MSKVKLINGLSDIYHNYDAFIIDQWGVMHDGEKAYQSAITCINTLFKNKKMLSIVSNSSKKNDFTILRLPQLGFNNKYFTEIITSGEMIWNALKLETHEDFKKLGKNCCHINNDSKEDGKLFIKGLEKFDFVDDIQNADFILGCTPFANKKIIDYIPILDKAKKNNLSFVCANPDFETVKNNFYNHSKKMVFCMGTLAELYKQIGGQVHILGKPNIEIYSQATKKFNNINKSRILAIGDSLHHDIKGAINFGIDSLLITSSGIHHSYFDRDKPNWLSSKNSLQKYGIEPTFICSEFNF